MSTHTMRPYDDIRVLDLTWWLGRYATRLFADLGAEVIRVEPPQGLPDRGDDVYEFAFVNASKKSITLALDTPDGRDEFARLAAGAQVIALESGGPLADDVAWVRGCNQAAVLVHVSPYGLGGPLSAAPASDLTLQAAGGIAWLSGRDGAPPLRLPEGQAAMVTSVYAATAAALCLVDTEREGGGGGAGHLIDVSAQECIAHSLQNALQVYDLERRISHRAGTGTRDATEDLFRCGDGMVFLAAPPQLGVSWKALLAWMAEEGHPGHAALLEPAWADRGFRNTEAARTTFRANFEAFISGRGKAELTAEALRRKVVLSPVSRIGEVLTDEQLQFRDYFVRHDDPSLGSPSLFPGPPYRLSQPVWRMAAAPPLGAHTDAVLKG